MTNYYAGTAYPRTPPRNSDPLTYLQSLTGAEYAGYGGEAMPLTGDYWTANSVFDDKSGFYTGFDLPLSPLGGALSMEEGEESNPLSALDLGDSGMSMARVSLSEARDFMENPGGFIDSKESPAVPAWVIYVVIGALCGSGVTAAAILLARRGSRPGKPENHQDSPPPAA